MPEDNVEKEGAISLGKILLADDEADVRKSVRMTLTKTGYDVLDAEDGDKAIKEIRSGDNPFMAKAIICDIHMPKVNGMEAIAFFRQEFPSVPVIVLTGEPEVAGATHLFKQGIVDYLAKPISPAKLTQVVHKAVRDHVFKDPFMT